MFRSLLLLVPALLAAGCHVPMPKFQPFAGSGSPRVPPPATGSYGKADSYYNGGAPAGAQSSLTTEPAGRQHAAAGGSNIMARNSSVGTWSVSDRSVSDQPVGTGALPGSTSAASAMTGHTQPAGASLPMTGASISRNNLTSPEDQPARHHSPVTFTSSERGASTSGGGLALNGMRINDATRTTEPQRFIPTGQVIDITQLPRVTAPSRVPGVRGFSQVGAAPSTAATPTPPQGATASTAGSTSSTVELSADGWHSKYIPQGVGVASN